METVEEGADQQGASDDVAEGDGDEVVHQAPKIYVGAFHHAGGDEEHVGDAVLESERNESSYGNQTCQKF